MSYATHPPTNHMNRPQSRPRNVPPNANLHSQRGPSAGNNMHSMSSSPQAMPAMHTYPMQASYIMQPTAMQPGQPMYNAPPQLAQPINPYGYYYVAPPTANPSGQYMQIIDGVPTWVTDLDGMVYFQQNMNPQGNPSITAPPQASNTGPGNTRPPSNPGVGGGGPMMHGPSPAMNQPMGGGYPSSAAPSQQQMPVQTYHQPQQQYPQQQMRPLTQPPALPQQSVPQAQLAKRPRNPIKIVNPDTGDVLNKDVISSVSTAPGADSSNHSTPTSSNRSTPAPPGGSSGEHSGPAAAQTKPQQQSTKAASSSSENDIANKFKAMVASKISSSNTSANSDTSTAPSVNGDMKSAPTTIAGPAESSGSSDSQNTAEPVKSAVDPTENKSLTDVPTAEAVAPVSIDIVPQVTPVVATVLDSSSQPSQKPTEAPIKQTPTKVPSQKPTEAPIEQTPTKVVPTTVAPTKEAPTEEAMPKEAPDSVLPADSAVSTDPPVSAEVASSSESPVDSSPVAPQHSEPAKTAATTEAEPTMQQPDTITDSSLTKQEATPPTPDAPVTPVLIAEEKPNDIAAKAADVTTTAKAADATTAPSAVAQVGEVESSASPEIAASQEPVVSKTEELTATDLTKTEISKAEISALTDQKEEPVTPILTVTQKEQEAPSTSEDVSATASSPATASPASKAAISSTTSQEHSGLGKLSEILSRTPKTTMDTRQISARRDMNPDFLSRSLVETKPLQSSTPSDTQLMPPPPTPGTAGSSPSDDKENTPSSPSIPSPAVMGLQTLRMQPTPGMKGSKSMAADMSKLPELKGGPRPLTPDGKKVYDRDFLMRLQNAELSQQKPSGLEILSEILARTPIAPMDARQISFKRDMNPDFFRPGAGSPRNSMSGQRSQKANSVSREKGGNIGSGGRQQIPKIDYTRSSVKLQKAENAWKADKAAGGDLSEEDKRHQELLKTFRGILNKITPQNFEKLLAKIMTLPVHRESDLAAAMKLVFEKAVAEPAFSVTYATLCVSMGKFDVPTDKDPEQMVSFRKLLLLRCQAEFEKSAHDDEEMVSRKAAINEATGAEKAQLEVEFDDFVTKARRRKLGNIRFIGELFKLGMLLPRIMHDCVVSLLKGSDEEGIECLCRLLTTIGKDLDVEKAKPRTDQYFVELKKIANGQTTRKVNVSARIRFAIRDVLELRENNWKPRRENSNPKTIKEIHAEAALEAHEKLMMIQTSTIPSRGSQSRNPPQRNDRNRREDDGGWNHVMKSQSQRIEPSKLKLTKQSFGETELQLGPARGYSGGWGRGSSISGKSTPPQQEDRPSTPTNRFNALQNVDGRDERSQSGQRLPTGRGSMGRGAQMAGRGSRMSITPRGSMEKERAVAVAAARQISRPGGSRGPSRENSVEGRRNMRTPTPTRSTTTSARSSDSKPSPTVKQLTKEDWEKKISSTIDEYVNNKDIKEAVDCIRELGTQTNADLIVECGINHTLEKKAPVRKAAGHLLAELVKHKLLTLDQYNKGLQAVLEFAEDLCLDIPDVLKYIAELVSPIFVVAAVPLDKLPLISTPLLSIGKCSTLVAAILHDASQQIGHIELGKRWNSSKLKWSEFLSSNENEEEFIKSNKLEFTLSVESSSPVAYSPSSAADIRDTLDRLLLKDSKPNDEIFDWIDVNVSSEDREQQPFIRSLTTAVARASLDNVTELNKTKFIARIPLLHKYFDTKPEREGYALFALEELMTKLQHPANLLNAFCDILTDQDLISDDSFFHWETTSKNGTAVKSVGKFLAWLRSEQEPEIVKSD